MKEWIKNKPYVDEDGIYEPCCEYTQEGTASNYKLIIPKEVFIEAFNKFCKNGDLPNEEDYVKLHRPQMDLGLNVKSAPKYRCPKCNGIMRRCEGFALASYPPQYRYECDDCDYTTSLTF